MRHPHSPTTVVFGDEFRRGKSYSTQRPGGSNDWLVIYTVAGSGAIGLPHGIVRTKPGDLLLYQPGVAQDYRTAPGIQSWRIRWAHFHPRPNWYPWMSWHEISPHVRLAQVPPKLRKICLEAFGRMIRASRHADSLYTALAMTALEEALLCGWATKINERDKSVDRRIERAITYLTDRFKDPFSLPEVAHKSGLSVSRFSDLFRREAGKTAGQFTEELRISHAAHLLHRTALSVGEIAAECGFNDPFYFTNRFRRHHRMSPTRFRAQRHAA